MRHTFRCTIVCLFALATWSGRSFAVPPTPDTAWRQFRNAYPHHTQTIALSEPDQSGVRTLIISEPPPHITPQQIQAVSPQSIGSPRVKTHRIGHDGRVADIVATISSRGEDELRDTIDRLSLLLFRTTYKAHDLRLRARAESSKVYPTDVHASALELQEWVLKENARFLPVLGGAERSLAQIEDQKRSTVYLSKTPGLVLWWLPRGIRLDNCLPQIRQFALDSDLVLGAVGGSKGVAIIARERRIPIQALPPLRAETLLLLAGVHSSSLQQSFERNHPLAGKLSDGKDIAPILLSPELVDTEFGSLLCITDQLLKSWSNKGEVTYEHFAAPLPDGYPFQKPLLKELAASSVVFNWNTGGAGYVSEIGEHRVFVAQRTGALPITYIAYKPGLRGTQVRIDTEKAETSAYKFFAQSGDANLTRVVQYTTLYQVFKAFQVEAAPPPAPAKGSGREPSIELVLLLLEELSSASNDALKEKSIAMLAGINLGDRRDAIRKKLCEDLIRVRDRVPKYAVDRREVAECIASPVEAELARNLLALAEASPEELDRRAVERARSVAGKDEEKYRQSYESVRRNLQDLQARLRVPGDLERLKLIVELVKLVNERPGELRRFAEISKLYDRLVAEANKRPTHWVRTPVLVVSQVIADMAKATGGHNVDAPAPRIIEDRAIPEQTVRVERIRGETVIKLNPRETPWSRDVVRLLSRGVPPNKVLPELERTSNPPPIRPRETALAGGGGKEPPPPWTNQRGLSFPEDGNERFRGFRPEREPDPALARKVEESARFDDQYGPLVALVVRAPEGKGYFIQGRDGTCIFASSYFAAVDALMELSAGRAKPGRIEVQGLNDSQFEALTATWESRSSKTWDSPSSKDKPAEPMTFQRWNEVDRRAAAERTFDLEKATARDPKVSADGRVIEQVFDLPGSEGGQLRVTLRTTERLEPVKQRGLLAALVDWLKRLFSGKSFGQIHRMDLGAAFDDKIKQLQKEGYPVEGIKMRFSAGLADVYFGKKEPNDDAIRRAVAGLAAHWAKRLRSGRRSAVDQSGV